MVYKPAIAWQLLSISSCWLRTPAPSYSSLLPTTAALPAIGSDKNCAAGGIFNNKAFDAFADMPQMLITCG